MTSPSQRYCLFWFAFALTLSLRSFAQAPNLTFDHVSAKEGLPSSNVYSIVADSANHLWLAIDDRGLLVFRPEPFYVWAYHTNLTPGDYTLQLNVADEFGHWQTKPLILFVRLRPTFYETWWFRTLVILAVVGSFYALYRYRVNQLLRLQRIRNHISADLHDEIGSSLSGIGILGTMAHQILPAGHPSGSMVERIVSEARMVSSSLDDIVWSINPRNDALSSLIARMNRYAAELFEASGIAYQITIPDHIERVALPMEQRRDFYLIFKESVNNLVKHAQATQAQVIISLSNKQLHLEVDDNGKGFDATAETDRNGLRNMYSRTQYLRGTLHIDTAPGQGTRLVLRFPLDH